MADVHDVETRRRNMVAIKGRDTKPELRIRKGLHSVGFRYRLHAKSLPGKPDLVLSSYKAVIFINGCFWHRHDCHLFKWPGTRQDFWRTKIDRNAANDQQNLIRLGELGWRVATVWECALKGRSRIGDAKAIQLLAEWLRSGKDSINIRGEELD